MQRNPLFFVFSVRFAKKTLIPFNADYSLITFVVRLPFSKNECNAKLYAFIILNAEI